LHRGDRRKETSVVVRETEAAILVAIADPAKQEGSDTDLQEPVSLPLAA
jgi:hypothetical protein